MVPVEFYIIFSGTIILLKQIQFWLGKMILFARFYNAIAGTGEVGGGVGRNNTCVMLNRRNNCTWQFLFAECGDGWRLLYSSKSTFHRCSIAGCLQGLLELRAGGRGLSGKSVALCVCKEKKTSCTFLSHFFKTQVLVEVNIKYNNCASTLNPQ